LHATPWQRVVPDPGPDARGREYAEIDVVDTGVGIRPEDLRRLFVAFLQLDGSSTRRHEGTGLGLAISARLAASMGGHIAVRSTPGQGSTFALLLPVGEPPRVVLDDEPLTSLSA
jgi:signal transduction histidine kinase